MARVGLLNSVCRKKPEGVDGAGLEGVCHDTPDEWNVFDFTIGHVAFHADRPKATRDNLYYTITDDSGQTFASPQVIADNNDSSLGNPGKPVLLIDGNGNIALLWLDRSGAHIASWIDTRKEGKIIA